MSTSQQYDEVIRECREVFLLKMKDYGPTWRPVVYQSQTHPPD